MHCSYRVCNYMEYCWLCSTWSNQLLSHSIGDGPSWASGFRPPAPGLPAKPKPVHRRVRAEQTGGDSHSLSRFFAVSLALSLWFSWFLTGVNTNTLTTTHGVCVWPLTSGFVCDFSGSSQNWLATPTPWSWFPFMTHWAQMPYGSSLTLVRTHTSHTDQQMPTGSPTNTYTKGTLWNSNSYQCDWLKQQHLAEKLPSVVSESAVVSSVVLLPG